MTSLEAVLSIARALQDTQTPYMLAGSFSSNLYGIPRSTKDADFVVQVDSGSIGRLIERVGPKFIQERQLSFETVTGTHRYIVDIPELPFKIELFVLSDDPHDQQRFQRRTSARLAGELVFVPLPEDVIITKLRWSQQGRRAKDVDDVRNILSVQGERLDFSYVYAWCDQHGTRELFDQIRATVPKI